MNKTQVSLLPTGNKIVQTITVVTFSQQIRILLAKKTSRGPDFSL